MIGSRFLTALALLTACAPAVARAQVTQTTGSGSAVTTVNASASFESEAALSGDPYLEDGLSFTRTNLTFDNNGCGYAGCAESFASFTGNYMYGTGVNGYFSIFAPTGQLFSGLELIAADGYSADFTALFTALLRGVVVGDGSVSIAQGTVLGFSSPTGFDELRLTENQVSNGNYVAPAFDEVRAQLLDTVVTPEPASLALVATGLTGVIGAVRRRRAR